MRMGEGRDGARVPRALPLEAEVGISCTQVQSLWLIGLAARCRRHYPQHFPLPIPLHRQPVQLLQGEPVRLLTCDNGLHNVRCKQRQIQVTAHVECA